jgi:hypothetical protein
VGLVNRSRMSLIAESSAASLGGEVRMRGRSVRAVNEVRIQAVGEAAVRDGRVWTAMRRTFVLAPPQLYIRRTCRDCSFIRSADMVYGGWGERGRKGDRGGNTRRTRSCRRGRRLPERLLPKSPTHVPVVLVALERSDPLSDPFNFTMAHARRSHAPIHAVTQEPDRAKG